MDQMRQIIDTFLTQKVEMSMFERSLLYHGHGRVRTGKSLIASLYSIKEEADPEILEAVNSIIVDIKQEMSQSEITLLLDNFPEVIRECYTDDITSSRVEVLTQDYINLLTGLSDFSITERILLPLGEICIAASFPQCKFDIVETTKVGWGIAHIISDILNLDVRIYNSFDELPEKEYAKIIAIGASYINNENDTIDRIISCIDNKLKEDEDAILLLPRRACYSSNWEKLREYLSVNVKKYLTHCLSLNIEQKYTVFGDECLMVITKNAPSRILKIWEHIVVSDFTGREFMIYDPVVGPEGLKIESIIESIKKGDKSYTRSIPVNKLDRGYNFLAARYFREDALRMKPELAEKLTELRDVVKVYQPLNFFNKMISDSGADTVKVISPRNLSENHLACNISLPEIATKELDNERLSVANGGYYSLFNNKALVGKILDQNEDIVGISDEVIHFEIKDYDKCSLDYILKELTENYSVEQARCFTNGLEMDGHLSIDDFLSIKIILPSLNEQNKILLDDNKKGYADKSEEIQRNFDEFRKNMHMQKHKVGQTISVLATWVNLLELARHMGKKEDSDIVIPAYKTTLGDIYLNIQDSLKTLQKEIAALDSSYGLEKSAKIFALADFLDAFCNKSCPNYQLVWNSKPHRYHQDLPCIDIDESDPDNLKVAIREGEYLIQAGDPIDYIYFPENALETILENIIANAVSHGFTDSQKNYKIRFNIERDGNKVILFVSNNGLPLHKDMTPSEVFTFGHTSGDKNHSGIGAYQIQEYMRAFGGYAEIISTPNDEYTVTYKLTFKDANPSIQVNL